MGAVEKLVGGEVRAEVSCKTGAVKLMYFLTLFFIAFTILVLLNFLVLFTCHRSESWLQELVLRVR